MSEEEYSRLTDGEISRELAELVGWQIVNGKLHKKFEFSGFIQAFGFMTRLAMEAEKMNHHPEWSNVYNRVVIDLVTHDIGGISNYDFRLARAIDAVAKS